MQASFASVNLDGAGIAAHHAGARLPDSSADSSGVSSDEESLVGHGTPAKVAHAEVRTLARLACCTHAVASATGQASSMVTMLGCSMCTCARHLPHCSGLSLLSSRATARLCSPGYKG